MKNLLRALVGSSTIGFDMNAVWGISAKVPMYELASLCLCLIMKEYSMPKASVYKRPQDFRVLFVYPNISMSALAPQGIGCLSAVLKKADFTCRLFDTTFYTTDLTTNANDEKVNLSIVRPFEWKERGIKPKTTDMMEDFRRMVDEFQPDLLAVSVVENTWFMADAMLSGLDQRIPTIVGGVFASHAPHVVINHPKVDYLCRGDGELALLSLCTALSEGKDATHIPGIWAKVDDQIHRTPIGPGIALDDLPFPDWAIFDEQILYRPMQGRVYKTIGIETQRGCPYKCTFCNSPSNSVLYREENVGNFHRKKSVKRIAEELEFMKKNYGPEFIYFVVDTFLALGDKEFIEFSEVYQDFRIPFWMNTRAETINQLKADHLDKMNCFRINIGIEHGNAEYRKKMLKRDVSNEKMLDAFRICAGQNFVTVANSIIGFPDETRDLIFDTINFNRDLPDEIEDSGAFIFTPFHGTPLRTLAVERGYVDSDTICSVLNTKGSILNMPQFTRDEIQGLSRTFGFYSNMPKEKWPDIRQAEILSPEGNGAFARISKEFVQDYRSTSEPPKYNSSFDLHG
jgi:anaerobic magnesium-protoporphyrin IX monomethyl ester cyclase